MSPFRSTVGHRRLPRKPAQTAAGRSRGRPGSGGPGPGQGGRAAVTPPRGDPLGRSAATGRGRGRATPGEPVAFGAAIAGAARRARLERGGGSGRVLANWEQIVGRGGRRPLPAGVGCARGAGPRGRVDGLGHPAAAARAGSSWPASRASSGPTSSASWWCRGPDGAGLAARPAPGPGPRSARHLRLTAADPPLGGEQCRGAAWE